MRLHLIFASALFKGLLIFDEIIILFHYVMSVQE